MADLVATADAANPGRALIPSPAIAGNGMGAILSRVKAFTAQPAVAKSLPMVGVIALLGIAALAWFLFSQPPQRDLFRGLTDSDKAAVADSLTTAGDQIYDRPSDRHADRIRRRFLQGEDAAGAGRPAQKRARRRRDDRIPAAGRSPRGGGRAAARCARDGSGPHDRADRRGAEGARPSGDGAAERVPARPQPARRLRDADPAGRPRAERCAGGGDPASGRLVRAGARARCGLDRGPDRAAAVARRRRSRRATPANGRSRSRRRWRRAIRNRSRSC